MACSYLWQVFVVVTLCTLLCCDSASMNKDQFETRKTLIKRDTNDKSTPTGSGDISPDLDKNATNSDINHTDKDQQQEKGDNVPDIPAVDKINTNAENKNNKENVDKKQDEVNSSDGKENEIIDKKEAITSISTHKTEIANKNPLVTKPINTTPTHNNISIDCLENSTDCNTGRGQWLRNIRENRGMLMRTFYVLLGVTGIVVLYFVIKAVRFVNYL